MLPVIACGLENADASALVDLLFTSAQTGGVQLQLQTATDEESEAERALEKAGGIALVLIGVGRSKTGQILEGVGLGRKALSLNRDHMLVYVVRRREDLETAVSMCVRPSGMIVLPCRPELADMVFSRTLEDYKAMIGDTEQNEDYLMLQVGRAWQRVAVHDMEYIEALDKKLVLYQAGSVMSLYASIADMEKRLGESFFRCHRSYLVRKASIRSINLARLEITLHSGARIPLARARRAEAQILLEQMKEGA